MISGLHDIYPETAYGGFHRDLYLNELQLKDTDMSTMKPVYYVTLTVLNAAGQLSEQKISSPIVIVPEDIPGNTITSLIKNNIKLPIMCLNIGKCKLVFFKPQSHTPDITPD